MIDLNNKIYEDGYKLSFDTSVLLAAHEDFFIIEEEVAQTAQDSCDELLNRERGTLDFSRLDFF